jgi:hypothetical protein
MSSSEAPTDAVSELSKSEVSAGTSDCGAVKPPPLPLPCPEPSRLPRNWTVSAIISMLCLLFPDWSSH